MTEPYLGVIIEQRAGGSVTVNFSDQTYHHPEITQDTIWHAIAEILEHYFTKHAEVVVMAKGEADNIYYLPKQVEDKRSEDKCERSQDTPQC